MRSHDKNPGVLIIRSGYATDEEWRTAIRTALLFGRTGYAIDAGGTRIPLSLWEEKSS